MAIGILKGDLFKDQIAAILILGAFVAIVIILFIHLYISNSVINQYISSGNDSMRINISNFYKDINASNLNIFSIIFSLFGAWVGAVLAFYFGSQSLERAHESLKQAQSSINQIVTDNKMSGVTIKELIDKNSDCKNVKLFTLENAVADIVKGAKDKNYPFVMIVNDVTNPTEVQGLLFMSDLLKVKTEKELEAPELKTLKKFLDDTEVIDGITKQKWITQSPWVQNFVPTTLEENLSAVYEKMIKKDPSLSVRAVVFENNKAIATVTYGNILSTIQK